MMYTVGEMAKLLNIAPSTLRYYDREGLLPFVERSPGGIRVFTEKDMGWLKIISCLKSAGMSLKDIRRYMEMAMQGRETIDDRLKMFLDQRERILQQMIREHFARKDARRVGAWAVQRTSSNRMILPKQTTGML